MRADESLATAAYDEAISAIVQRTRKGHSRQPPAANVSFCEVRDEPLVSNYLERTSYVVGAAGIEPATPCFELIGVQCF